MSEHDAGQVQASAAEVYDSLFVPALFGNFVAPVADAAAIGSTEALVDVACGTGALTREARSRTVGRVVGVDVNPRTLTVARSHRRVRHRRSTGRSHRDRPHSPGALRHR